jgi:O-antigen/teichoic acid export membrane protein
VTGVQTCALPISIIAAAWTGAAALGLILLGRPLLFQDWTVFGRSFHIYEPEYLPALSVLMVLLIGFGFANIFFWSRPLLLAQGLAGLPLKVGFWSMLAKVALSFLLIQGLGMGYLTEAALLSGYFVVSVGWVVWRGLREIRRAEAHLDPGQAAASPG